MSYSGSLSRENDIIMATAAVRPLHTPSPSYVPRTLSRPASPSIPTLTPRLNGMERRGSQLRNEVTGVKSEEAKAILKVSFILKHTRRARSKTIFSCYPTSLHRSLRYSHPSSFLLPPPRHLLPQRQPLSLNLFTLNPRSSVGDRLRFRPTQMSSQRLWVSDSVYPFRTESLTCGRRGRFRRIPRITGRAHQWEWRAPK